MREIKFRGKRVDNGEWVYGYYVFYGHMGVFKHIIITNWAQVYTNSFYVETNTVGQYTGLNDRDGIDIYEGDVVKDNEEKISYVAFLQQEMGYVLAYPKYDTRLGHRTRGSSYHMDCGLEVIGNIYDNPELRQS